MRPPKYTWPDTDGSRGVLMFAQLMSAMLNPKTFESFRVYSLDTMARLSEALELAEDVRLGRVPPATLTPIIEELDWSLRKDAAAQSLALSQIDSFFNVIRNKNNVPLADFTFHIILIQKLLRDRYKLELENLILACFDQDKKKSDLRKLTGFYCSHIINLGYARRHVLHLVNSYFFDHQIQRVGRATLGKFFREFDGKLKKFSVHIAITKELGHYLRGLRFPIRDVNSLTNDQQNSLSTNANFAQTPLALEMMVDRLDPYGAAAFGHQLLGAQRAISYLDPIGMRSEWGDTLHVARARAQSGTMISKVDFLLAAASPKPTTSGNRLRNISNYARSIFTNFDSTSTERLLSSINTASLARMSANPENQLISFWSAVEVLLSEPRDQPRIVHYAGLITPCIALRHTRRQVTNVYDQLLIAYKNRFRKLLEQVGTRKPIVSARTFAELMFLPANAPHRQSLCNLLANNPLALHRVWKMNNDFADLKSVELTLRDHYNRVNWQLHRIYRARNQLVHSGRVPSYLESVILNLAEYYRSSIATIINRARVEPFKSDIDQIVAEIGIQYGIVKTKFERRGQQNALTEEHLALLMDHSP